MDPGSGYTIPNFSLRIITGGSDIVRKLAKALHFTCFSHTLKATKMEPNHQER